VTLTNKIRKRYAPNRVRKLRAELLYTVTNSLNLLHMHLLMPRLISQISQRDLPDDNPLPSKFVTIFNSSNIFVIPLNGIFLLIWLTKSSYVVESNI